MTSNNMRLYRVLWKPKDDFGMGYFAIESYGDHTTIGVDKSGKRIFSIDHDHRVRSRDIIRDLKNYTKANPVTVTDNVRRLGGRVQWGRGDYQMTPEAAARIRQMYGDLVRLVPLGS